MPAYSCFAEDHSSLPMRLDRYVSEILNILSRSQIRARNLNAKINGKEVKISRLVKAGDNLEIFWDDPPIDGIIAENIPLEIVWEDENCIVVNKAQGLVVHPGAGNRQGTLANALYYRKIQRNGSASDAGLRPGIVHRLDKETSGIIIAAWDERTHLFLSDQFKNRKVKKSYIAIVCGVPKDAKGRIETNISRDPANRKRFTVSANGRHSVTFYKIIKQWKNHSLLLLRPKTGRTHQLRVHMRWLGCPILGDPVYGKSDSQFPDASLMLHSKRLEIILPGETKESIFTSPVPDRFLKIMEKLGAPLG
ncbi:MAG: RluA family pseudouridine synthase [Treponema sp.]|nr:RluA family pseudouridine synthase [Treponema sp.]